MMPNTLMIILAGLIATITSSALAQTNSQFQFDDVIYTLPKGWKKGKTLKDHVVLYESESDLGFRSFRVFRSEPIPQSIERWIDKKIESTLDDDVKIKGTMGTKKLAQKNFDVYLSARMAKKNLLIAYTMIGNGKANFVLMQCRMPDDKQAVKLFSTQLQKELLPFCLGLKYVSQGAKKLLGQPTAGELEGTYSGLKYTYNLDLSVNFDQEFYTFSKSGQFVRGLPKGTSVTAIDYETAIQERPNRAGNYRIARGKIHFDFADGTKKIEDYEKTEKGFKLNHKYNPVTVPANGTRFEGLFRDFHYSGFVPGSGVTGGITQQRTLRFTKSGKFEATQFVATFGNFENSVGDSSGGFSSANNQPEFSGTYDVKNGTLQLTNQQGNVAVSSLVQLGDKLLYVDGVQYLKKDKRDTKNSEKKNK